MIYFLLVFSDYSKLGNRDVIRHKDKLGSGNRQAEDLFSACKQISSLGTSFRTNFANPASRRLPLGSPRTNLGSKAELFIVSLSDFSEGALERPTLVI